MSRGARQSVDLERAIRTLQRRARDHEARLRLLELTREYQDRESADPIWPRRISPAPPPPDAPPPFSAPVIAGTASLPGRLFSRLRTWARSLFFARREKATDGNA